MSLTTLVFVPQNLLPWMWRQQAPSQS